MQAEMSFLDKRYVVSDPDARLRLASDLSRYITWQTGELLAPGASVGGFKVIPIGTRVTVHEVRLAETGSSSRTVFGRTFYADTGVEIGWTSTRNFQGKFIGETVGKISPAAGAGKYSPTAVWSKGSYVGQTELMEIVDADLEIERIALATAMSFLTMVEAAAASNVPIYLTSAFRTYAEQKYLYEGYINNRPGFNTAAKPGFSRHQNGVAFDIQVFGAYDSIPYNWLAKHATTYGFIRTVSGEPWHWEYSPTEAATGKAGGKHVVPGVNP